VEGTSKNVKVSKQFNKWYMSIQGGGKFQQQRTGKAKLSSIVQAAAIARMPT
jgi:hypothetical protein